MIRQSPRHLAHDRGGTAAVEFALIMPVVLLLFLGCIDVGRMLSWVEQARRAMIASADAASAAACTPSQDGTSCTVSLSNSQLSQIMQGIEQQATSGIWSNTTANGLIMTVIQSDNSGNLTITTQTKYPATLTGASMLGCKASATPTGYAGVKWEKNDMFIVSELFFTYKPFTFAGGLLKNTGLQSTHDMFVFRPRQTTSIINPAGTC